jgi:hypothetical protein
MDLTGYKELTPGDQHELLFYSLSNFLMKTLCRLLSYDLLLFIHQRTILPDTYLPRKKLPYQK